MWTVSAVQQHRKSIIVCDVDSTAELRVKTVSVLGLVAGVNG